jgi:hypothetical protein
VKECIKDPINHVDHQTGCCVVEKLKLRGRRDERVTLVKYNKGKDDCGRQDWERKAHHELIARVEGSSVFK